MSDFFKRLQDIDSRTLGGTKSLPVTPILVAHQAQHYNIHRVHITGMQEGAGFGHHYLTVEDNNGGKWLVRLIPPLIQRIMEHGKAQGLDLEGENPSDLTKIDLVPEVPRRVYGLSIWMPEKHQE